MMKSGLAACVALGLAGLSVPARAEWITSWSAAPVRPTTALGPMLQSPSFEDRTIRQVVRIAAGGKAIRLRLSNAYGAAPLEIGGAQIILLDAQGAERPETARVLRFAGQGQARIAAGAPLLSDPIDLAVPDLARVAISLYLPSDTGPCTCHGPALEEAWVSPEGDFLGRPFEPAQRLQVRAFLASVEVDAAAGAGTIAVLGDSISDGVGSTVGADRRWPDGLAEALSKRWPGRWGIANQGISGNRVLLDGFGESALARFDRDILALPGLRYVVIFEGVNDLGMSYGRASGPAGERFRALAGPKADAAQIIAAYHQLVTRAHARGVKVYGATIAPYKGAALWSEEGEAVRQQINDAIRAPGLFDGLLDFDKALRDEADPLTMREGYHMGDHLHGSDVGYRAVAASIDPGMFAQ
jgi:lysophospholipase L1-like esterase